MIGENCAVKRLTMAIFFLVASVNLHAASFDCAKARTSVEKAICSTPALGAADDRLMKAYFAALTRAPEATALVRKSQQKWLQHAERRCQAAHEKQPLASCLLEKWNDRIDFLGRIVVRMNGVGFFYRDFSHDQRCDDGEETKAKGKIESNTETEGSRDAVNERHLCSIHATWPEAISTAPEWLAWNRALLDEARRFNASQDTEANVPEDWVLFEDPTWHSDVEVSVDLNVVTPTLVVATIKRDYSYAHPARDERAFNWLLKERRELKPDDLFEVTSGWEAWMRTRIGKVVMKREPSKTKEAAADAEQDAARAAEVELQSRYWRIEREGLGIIFTQEAVGYPDCLTTTATFSWSELKPYLNPRFDIPR